MVPEIFVIKKLLISTGSVLNGYGAMGFFKVS